MIHRVDEVVVDIILLIHRLVRWMKSQIRLRVDFIVDFAAVASPIPKLHLVVSIHGRGVDDVNVYSLD